MINMDEKWNEEICVDEEIDAELEERCIEERGKAEIVEEIVSKPMIEVRLKKGR